MSHSRDDLERDNMGKIWWVLTLLVALLFWFVATFILYRASYQDDLTPRTPFNPFTNVVSFGLGLLFALLIMSPFRPESDP